MNFAGTSKHGGVLLVAGDDHGAYSSTLPHQSDHLFSASMIPVLYPCNVQEYVELGLHGWAMSRFSGCAIAFKALADTVESSASIEADPFRVKTLVPTDFVMPEGGLNCRLSSDLLGLQARKQEALMQDYKIYAAMAYARLNRLNRTTIDSPNARLGIIASGKSYMDVLEALEELGITEENAAQIGIRLFKVSMPWPLEPDGVREFSKGLEEILVVEEKRQMVEYQLKEQLYNWRTDVRPRVIGKFDEQGEWVHPRGEWLLPAKADFSIAQIARVIAGRIARFHQSDLIKARLAFLDAKGSGAEEGGEHSGATTVLLLGLPAQYVDQSAGRQSGAGRHRLPRDGHRDLSRAQQDHHATWAAKARLDRPGAVLEADAHLRQPRRRHLFSFRVPRDSRGARGERQHHLQDPLQRCRRHDRRAAGGRADFGKPDRATDGGRRRQAHRAW